MDEVNVEKEFGESAGKVWMALNKQQEKSADQIAKETKLKINNVYAGLGWLGREGKLVIKKNKTGTTYRLTENN